MGGPINLDPLPELPPEHFRRFVRVVAIKALCTAGLFAAATTSVMGYLGLAAAAVGLILLWRGNLGRVGASLVLVALLNVGAGMWPYTLNHTFLEVVLVVALVGFWPHGSERNTDLAVRIIWCAALSVWLWGGVQKLVHGYYVNGEYFALAVVFDDSILADRLRWVVNWSREFQGVEPIVAIAGGPIETAVKLPLTALDWTVLITMARTIVVAEVLLPLTILSNRFRRTGIFVLIFVQIAIAVVSGEFDFAITGVAVLLLGAPRLGRVGYPLLMLAAVALAITNLISAWGGGS